MCLFFVCQIFQGNTNPTDVAKAAFPKPTLTRYLRIRPYSWESGIALRFEVYGCKISGWFHKNWFFSLASKQTVNSKTGIHKKNQFRSRVLIQIWKQFFVNTPLHHDLSIRWFTFCLLWRQANWEVFIHASECTRAIFKEILHYRQVFTSTKRTVYSCFPTFGCTSFKMNGVHSMQPLHFYPIFASTLLLWALTSQRLTHTDVHIAHAIVHAEIYTHQPQSGPAGPCLICILICMFWHGSTLQSFDCKGFRIISASLLRTFPHMCRRRASLFSITHRLSALHSTCTEGVFFRLCVCVHRFSTGCIFVCVCVRFTADLERSCCSHVLDVVNRPHSKHITRAKASQWHHQCASGSLVMMRPSWATA